MVRCSAIDGVRLALKVGTGYRLTLEKRDDGGESMGHK